MGRIPARRTVSNSGSEESEGSEGSEVSVMAIVWNPSRGATLGVEWEVQLIDSETRMLRQEASKLLSDMPVVGGTGEHPQIHHELPHGIGGQGRPGQDDFGSPAGGR